MILNFLFVVLYRYLNIFPNRQKINSCFSRQKIFGKIRIGLSKHKKAPIKRTYVLLKNSNRDF